jgi:hypothetical protein
MWRRTKALTRAEKPGTGVPPPGPAIILRMIPESAGTTLFGIFVLAVGLNEAASHVVRALRLVTPAAARLLYYHTFKSYSAPLLQLFP